jgi:NADH-quinone oxidoreductase subunit N
MNAPTATDLWALLPVILLCAGALAVLLADLVLRAGTARSIALFGMSIAFTAAALSVSVWQCSAGQDLTLSPALASQWMSRPFTLISAVLLEAIVLLVLLALAPWMRAEDKLHEGEAYTLLLLFPVGGVLMVAGRDLMVVFIGLEILSLSLYVLTAMRRTRLAAVEAGMKYFMLGAFAAGFFVYGAALLYGGNGNLTLPELGPVSRPGLPAPTGLAAIGGGLVFVALFFKASLAPFHMWTPDVYEGAGTPVTALMSTGTKAAAFVVLIAVAPWLPREMIGVIPLLAVVTMVAGNVGAIAQTNVKRLIAYSGIAHAGYLMVGYTALVKGEGMVDAGLAIRAMLFYLATYAVTNLGALAVIAYLERRDERSVEIDGLRGVSRRHAWPCARCRWAGSRRRSGSGGSTSCSARPWASGRSGWRSWA